jgi:hexosaminidase
MNYLKTDNLAALVPDRGASSAQNVRSAQNLQSLMLSLTGNPSFGGGDSSDAVMSISEAAIAGLGAEDESYILDIPADGGNANLTAKTALGLLRGMTTFAQLWFYVDGMTYTLQAPMQIQDAPYVSDLGFLLHLTFG